MWTWEEICGMHQGTSINYVTHLREVGQWFCDYITEALVLKSLTMQGKVVKNYPETRNFIFRLPLTLSFTNTLIVMLGICVGNR